MVKVSISVPEGPVVTEKVWAEQVGPDSYRLCNAPWFAYGFAEGDVVRCTNSDDTLAVAEVIERSGNYNIRIYFKDGIEDALAQSVLGELVSVGCSYEWGPVLASVTVPQSMEVSFWQLANYLTSQADGARLKWEIGYGPEE